MKNRLLVPVEWLGIALAMMLMPILPHRLLLVVCDFVSFVMYRLDRRGRIRALFNLRIITGRVSPTCNIYRLDVDAASYDPTSREEKIIRRSYRNMSRTIGHLVWTSFMARRRAAAVGIMSSEGKELLARNRPAITVSAHLGCWEILSQLAFLEGHQMMSVAKDIGTNSMTRLLMRARRSIGQEIVPAKGAFKVLMNGIRNGRSLGLLVDQHVDPQDGGVWVRFLDRMIPVSVAPAFFSAKSGATIITAWSRPLKSGHYRCEILSHYTSSDARDVWAMTQRCANDIEAVVRRHPSCWVLNYNYFSNVPTEADFAALAKRTKPSFVPRPPREVVYHVRSGFEDKIHYRLLRDLSARTDDWPLRLTVFVTNAAMREVVERNCQFAVSRFADVNCEVEPSAERHPRIAVIIPGYNVERFLPQCLDSLLAQTCPVDIFCCNDGSTDGTGRILDEYAARYSRVHALHHPNRGMSATYNRLLDELPSEYEFVGIVDSDDYVHPEMYDSLLSAMVSAGADVAECGIASVSEADVQPAGTTVAHLTDPHHTIDDMSVYWLRKTAPAGWISKWNKLYRRAAIGNLRFRIGLDYEDDFFFATEVNAKIKRKVIVSDRFYAYRRNPNSLNGKINFRKYVASAALRLRLSCETFFVTGNVPPRLRTGWLADLTKDAYRMLVRKNLKKNADPALRRELFFKAGEEIRQLAKDFGLSRRGLSPVQRLVFDCCVRGRYVLASLLVRIT